MATFNTSPLKNNLGYKHETFTHLPQLCLGFQIPNSLLSLLSEY